MTTICWTGLLTVVTALSSAPPPVQSCTAFVFGFFMLRQVFNARAV